MRVFRIGSDDQFTEYKRLPFEADHEERVLEKWLGVGLTLIRHAARLHGNATTLPGTMTS